ncbi:ParB/RepB/Spo0J family partition protein [Cupriavidus sp. D39]|uniref:ParB/RepB/Spo0J family partition protein n=1 Tax=Cupriavidus sp. D39 TaxID=2997877 RepID=UPI002271C0A9|nr:ParB N-terminal domain-containing protein [Cupriavidus sp. D39]MCY0856871.1 ParB N-terminal domain-containing protein [Cupriavidus sp. D39]
MNTRRPPEVLEREMALLFEDLMRQPEGSINIPVNMIRSSPYRCRVGNDEAHIKKLMSSISEIGLITPIVVRRMTVADTRGSLEQTSDNTTFELVAGHYRTEAFRRMGRATIPGIIRPLSDAEAARALTADNALSRPMSNENEVTIQREGRVVKMTLLDGEAKITGDINFDKLRAIIDANLLALQRD